MSTIRQQVRDAVIAALNDARDPDLPEATKRRWVPSEENRCPAIGVFFLEEPVQQVGGRHGGLVERSLRIAVQCVNSVTDPAEADDSVEPLLAHAIERLGKSNLGGLANDVLEAGTKWEFAQLDRYYLAATAQWSIQFSTKRNDASAKQ